MCCSQVDNIDNCRYVCYHGWWIWWWRCPAKMSYLYYLHAYIFTYDSYDVSIIRLFTITI